DVSIGVRRNREVVGLYYGPAFNGDMGYGLGNPHRDREQREVFDGLSKAVEDVGEEGAGGSAVVDSICDVKEMLRVGIRRNRDVPALDDAAVDGDVGIQQIDIGADENSRGELGAVPCLDSDSAVVAAAAGIQCRQRRHRVGNRISVDVYVLAGQF